MGKSQHSFLPIVVAIFWGWLPVVNLLLNPPTLVGDEAYYARVPVEMKERGDWIVPYFNGEPRYKKPPLMYWLVAASQSLLGENEQASRLPSLVAVLLTSALLVWFGFRIGNSETGVWAAVAFLLNPMTAILGNWGAPEATLCFFITASVLLGFVWLKEHSLHWLLLSGAAAGFGTLTKGAPGLVIPTLALSSIVVFNCWLKRISRAKRFEVKTIALPIGLWLLTCIAVVVPWFVAIGIRKGDAFWQVFLWREHVQRVSKPMEGHSGPIWFYLLVVWLLFLPWSARLPHAFTRALGKVRQRLTEGNLTIEFCMAWWAASTIVLFSLIATKLPHYIFPAYPALAWLCASQLQRGLDKNEFFIGLTLTALPAALAFYVALVAPDAYSDFLRKFGFRPGFELEAIKFSSWLLVLGLASVFASWLFSTNLGRLLPAFGSPKCTLLVSGAALTFVSLVVVSVLMTASGGRHVVSLWLKSSHVATFGSDTEWVVFYAQKPVPFLGRDRERLKAFLTKYHDAAILARVDFAPALRDEGLRFIRIGLWGVALKDKR